MNKQVKKKKENIIQLNPNEIQNNKNNKNQNLII